MGRINYFDIQFSQTPTGMFYSGQQLQGMLVIDVAEPVSVRALFVLLSGDSRTFWVNKTSDKIYESHDPHFNTRLDLSITGGPGAVSPDGQTLPQGCHSLPFAFQLPDGLPSTFEGEYGNTRYMATGQIELYTPSRFMGSGATSDYHVEKAFVVSPFNGGRPMHMNMEPIRSYDTVEMVGCMGKAGMVEIDLTVAKPEFRVGEQLVATVTIRNASRSRVKSLEFLLFQHTRFQAVSRYESVSDFKDMSRVVDAVPLGHLGTGKRQQWPLAVQIPITLPPSQTGRIIGIAYWVKVLSKDGIEVTAPITIST